MSEYRRLGSVCRANGETLEQFQKAKDLKRLLWAPKLRVARAAGMPLNLRNDFARAALCPHSNGQEALMGKGIILWLCGVPLSVIILLAIFTNWI